VSRRAPDAVAAYLERLSRLRREHPEVVLLLTLERPAAWPYPGAQKIQCDTIPELLDRLDELLPPDGRRD
jgi:hypothetical protein